MYKRFIRPILFQFDPEKVHYFTFSFLKILHKIPLVSRCIRKRFCINDKRLETEVFGIKFPNPVGLAAGLDKNATLYKELSCFGFGFIEIGTITPKPQDGNPKKRLFRLKSDQAIINRMGFNNHGIAKAVEKLKSNPNIIIGGNIGKNKLTPNENAVEDYKICFEALFDYVDYFVVNVSSPNTPNLRTLQEKEPLKHLLGVLQQENHKKSQPKPILLKIAPDLTDSQLLDIIEIVNETRISGVIATNTTINREGLSSTHRNETGGLSGKPLTQRSTQVIRFLSQNSHKSFPIIGVGGIHTPSDAIEKLEAGASLVQVFTGFIYEGPELIKKINKTILKTYHKNWFPTKIGTEYKFCLSTYNMFQKFKHIIDIQSIRKLFSFVRPYQKMFWWVVILAILFSTLGVIRVYLLKDVIDLYIVPKDYNGLVTITCLMLAVLVAEISSEISFLYYANWVGQYVIKDIRNALFKNIIHFRMQYYHQSSVGRLVTNTVNDMERIAEVFSSGLFEIFSDILKMLIVAGVMIYVDWRLSVIVLGILPLVLYATRWFQNSMKIAFSQVRTQVGNLNSFVQERITGMKIIQLFNRENTEYHNFKTINKSHEKAWLKNIWYNSIFFPIVELLTSITIGLVVWYGGLKTMEHSMHLGTIFMFIQLIQMFFKPLKHIADKFNTLQMGIIATQRVFGVINQQNNFGELQQDKKFVPSDGIIEFKNVHFGYNKEEEILHGISFKVEKGQKVAIVGATGAGKSTIIHLINRFYEIQKGSIYIDNQDISKVDLTSLRQHIGVVLQDVFLFADTIHNNITLKNPDISRQQVIQAAKTIDIHSFFEQLPNNYDYNVKERGTMLSSGQRQLIAFLRAYVHQPKILILDEATSSVDSHLEQLIEKAIDKITQGRTSILIAHRLATIQKADKIIVLDKGRIVEEGSHQALLQIPNGYYKNLYDIQFVKQNNI